MTEKKKRSPEEVVREFKRNTRRKSTSEEKIRFVLEGLRGEYYAKFKIVVSLKSDSVRDLI